MTLSVSAYSRGADGGFVEIALASDLAGFESTRRSFFGTQWARALGLRLLPYLGQQSELWVEGDLLRELAEEAAALRAAVRGRDDEEYWVSRLANIATAIALAGPAGAICIC